MTQSKFLPKVSVVIPIYNGEEDVLGLIECLREQTYRDTLVEYLLVNNNSSDKTGEILEVVCKESSAKGKSFQQLHQNQIQSSYAARNVGIRASSGDIIAFTDADCRPHPNWVEKLIEPFIVNQIGVVVGEISPLPGNSLLEKYAERCGVMSQKFLLEHPFKPYGQTANLAIRRVIFEQIGLFRPYLTTGGDADICWRISLETDWQLTFSPDAIIEHRHRSNLADFQSQWRRYGSSNKYLHELYGIELMRELTIGEISYKLLRWLIQEIPRDTLNILRNKSRSIDLLKTPISLLGFQARNQGQKQAQLPQKAQEIEYL